MAAWRKPGQRRIGAVQDRLRKAYGRARLRPHGEPLDELILTVLSQSTNDRNRDVAYLRLRERFPSWESVAAAPVDEIEAAIQPGGISKVKAPRIKAICQTIANDPRGHGSAGMDLHWLADLDPLEARHYLEGLPGVGRKTAACVLLFACGWPELPVDTHVYRVSERLELIPPGASFEQAHDTLLELIPDDEIYEFHINLLRHGRRICRPQPQCKVCVLRDLCPYAQSGSI